MREGNERTLEKSGKCESSTLQATGAPKRRPNTDHGRGWSPRGYASHEEMEEVRIMLVQSERLGGMIRKLGIKLD